MGHCCDCSTKAGAMSLVASLLLTAGWTLNVVAISVCNFVSTSSGLDNNEQLLYAMGFYTVQGRDGICYVVNWNDWSQNIPYWTNTAMTTARICGGVAALIGFIAMIFGWFLPCFGGGGRCIRITIAVCALISCILAGFMFMFNTSSVCDNAGCKFSLGSGLAVGAMLSYFFAACLLCIAPNPVEEQVFVPPAATAGAAQDTVTVERTEHPDGTVTVTKTTTHADGSKTVEQTTETNTADNDDVEAQGSKTNSEEEEAVPAVTGTPVDTSTAQAY